MSVGGTTNVNIWVFFFLKLYQIYVYYSTNRHKYMYDNVVTDINLDLLVYY